MGLKNHLRKTILFPFYIKFRNRIGNRCNKWSKVTVGSSRLKDCSFEIVGDSRVCIGDGCNIRGLHMLVYGDGSSISIGNNVRVNASTSSPVVMNAFNGTHIIIGNECLFSNGIEIHTTDYHSILTLEGELINRPQDVVLSDHVWVGLRSVILKGVHIAPDSVIGAGSIVTKSFDEANTVICGNPAKCCKSEIYWNIKSPIQ